MYLSTLFLDKLEYGATIAITECNKEFIERFSEKQDYTSTFFIRDSSNDTLLMNVQGDELMALWDVFKDFKDETASVNLPIIKAMDEIRSIRNHL